MHMYMYIYMYMYMYKDNYTQKHTHKSVYIYYNYNYIYIQSLNTYTYTHTHFLDSQRSPILPKLQSWGLELEAIRIQRFRTNWDVQPKWGFYNRDETNEWCMDMDLSNNQFMGIYWENRWEIIYLMGWSGLVSKRGICLQNMAFHLYVWGTWVWTHLNGHFQQLKLGFHPDPTASL